MNDRAIMRRAVAEDADALTDITIRSKAHWGYSKAFMKKALPYLRVSAEHIETEIVTVIEEKGRLVAYSMMDERVPGVMWLESLFVLPEAMGKGYGARLLDRAIEEAAALGYRRLEFESDPNAEGFYLRKGAIRIGERESGIEKGRFLPLMRIALKGED